MIMKIWTSHEKHLGSGKDHLIYQKGVFRYSYITGPARFYETQLSPIDCLYDKFKDRPLKQDYYERAKAIWDHFVVHFARIPRSVSEDGRFALGGRLTGRLHGTIVGPTGLSDWSDAFYTFRSSDRPVGPTQATSDCLSDQSDRRSDRL